MPLFIDKREFLFYIMKRLFEGVVRTGMCDLSTNPVSKTWQILKNETHVC